MRGRRKANGVGLSSVAKGLIGDWVRNWREFVNDNVMPGGVNSAKQARLLIQSNVTDNGVGPWGSKVERYAT